MTTRLAFLALLFTTGGVASLASQAVPMLSLGTPTATSPTEFSMINGVREFRDGSLLLADPVNKLLYRADRALRTWSAVGRNGAGPGEYRQPDAVFGLPGDSVLVTDLGNARLMEFDASMRPGRVYPIVGGNASEQEEMTLMLVSAVDGQGRLYFRTRLPGADSSRLVRYDRRSQSSTTVAHLKDKESRTSVSGGPGNRSVSVRQIPLSREDGWAVRADGGIYLVRSGNYHVEVIQPDGRVSVGKPVVLGPIPIRNAEREEYLVEQQRSGGIGISVSTTSSGRSVAMSRESGKRRAIDEFTWPDVSTPFNPEAIWVDARDRLWVNRHQPAGRPWQYDIFDPSGAHVASIVLPEGRRVIGMGAESVYLVRFDIDDLQYLERYRLPR